MPQEIVLRKRERDGNKVCTTYGISEPSYKFTLDTCDNIEATIKNTSGLTVAILTLNAPTTVVTKKGNYNICIEGVGIGTLYAEWTQSGSAGGEDCCDELREKDRDLQNQINNLKSRVTNVETIINNLGDNCCDELRTEINNLKTRITTVENRLNNQNITGGTGISVTKNGDSYIITNTGGGGSTGSDCCDELRSEINNIKTRLTTIEGDITNLKSRMTTVEGNVTNVTNRLNNQNITGGTGISVTKSGDSYTITNTAPGSTECCEEITNRLNNMTFTGGTGISVTKSGDNYTITNTAPGGGGGSGATDCCDELRQKDTELQQQITNVTNRLNNQNITGGTGISVTKSGDSYTITNTAPAGGSQDKDTVTTLVPGNGVSITDSGTGGNHVYTITASGGGGSFPADFNIVGGTNTQVSKNGNVYTISATDTNTETVLSAGDNVSITDNGTGGNHNYRIDVADSGPDDYMVYSKNSNIIVTAMGNDQEENIFLYDASIAGATADNNQISDFETGTDKIEIKGTSLPKGQLTQFATQGAGIYYSNGILSYNDGTNVKTIVKVVDGSTVAAADVTII